MLTLDKRGNLKLSEAQIQKQCIEYLRLERWPDGSPVWEVYETHSHHAYASAGEPGQPDVVAVEGLTLGVLRLEVKAEGRYRTRTQREWAERHGVEVHTVRSLHDLKAVLTTSRRQGAEA